MLNLLLACTLSFAPPTVFVQQDPADETPDQGPDPALVEEAVRELESAFKKGKTPERVAAIQKYGEVNDHEVIVWIDKGLQDKDPLLKQAAIEALRWLPNPEALDCLHTSLRKDKKLKDVETLHVELIKAIGQHASPSSIESLMDNALADAPREVSIARVYSLGNIRDKQAVKALMDLMQRTGSRGRKGGGTQPLMKQFAVSLEMLTAQAHGQEEQAWIQWWRDNEKTFEVTKELGRVTPKTKALWTKYWAAPKPAEDAEGAEDGKKRGDRKKKGEDGEGGED